MDSSVGVASMRPRSGKVRYCLTTSISAGRERLEHLARHYALSTRPFLLHGGSAAQRRSFAEQIHAHSGSSSPLHRVEGEDPALAEIPAGEHLYLCEVEALGARAQRELLAGIREERWRVIAGTQGLDPDRLREDLYALLEAGFVAVDRVGEPVAV